MKSFSILVFSTFCYLAVAGKYRTSLIITQVTVFMQKAQLVFTGKLNQINA